MMRKQERIEKETMAISHFRRFTALTLSCCLLFSAVQLPSCAAEESAETGTRKKIRCLFRPEIPSEEATGCRRRKRIKIIVELEEKPLLSYVVSATSGSSSVTEFFETDRAKELQRAASENRQLFRRELTRSNMDVEIEREYSVVMNGFCVEAAYGDLDGIRSMDGVKNALFQDSMSIPILRKPGRNCQKVFPVSEVISYIRSSIREKNMAVCDSRHGA